MRLGQISAGARRQPNPLSPDACRTFGPSLPSHLANSSVSSSITSTASSPYLSAIRLSSPSRPSQLLRPVAPCRHPHPRVRRRQRRLLASSASPATSTSVSALCSRSSLVGRYASMRSGPTMSPPVSEVHPRLRSMAIQQAGDQVLTLASGCRLRDQFPTPAEQADERHAPRDIIHGNVASLPTGNPPWWPSHARGPALALDRLVP